MGGGFCRLGTNEFALVCYFVWLYDGLCRFLRRKHCAVVAGKGLVFIILSLCACSLGDFCVNCRWGLYLRLRDSNIEASVSLSVGFEVSLGLVSTGYAKFLSFWEACF